ncbi:MAG: carbon-nitrogen hydrolase family protein [Deltaproteobacteria bacterium]|nr:carbon-nitrogen hydrolase family protein [Deltaproteobacteria bacterium]
MVKAAAVQMDVVLARPEENKDRILKLARETEADLVVFPECANSGYVFTSAQEALPYADSVPGPFVEQLAAVAKECNRCLAVGLLEKDGDTLYNSAALITSQGQLHLYRKTHMPYIGLDRFLSPGDRLDLFDSPLGKVGLAICYDWRFPELARSLALQGADLLIGLSNWPDGAQVIPSVLLPARAAENRVWIVSSNRVGTERGVEFIGRSAIISPDGETLCALDGREEGVALGEIDLTLARNKRLVKKPGEYEVDLWRDRRPSLYRAVTRGEENA